MIDMQVSLTEAQLMRLREFAAARGVCLFEIVRGAVDETLRTAGREARIERAVNSLGGFRSGQPDTAEIHDAALDPAYCV